MFDPNNSDNRICNLCLKLTGVFVPFGWHYCYLNAEYPALRADYHFCPICRNSKRGRDIISASKRNGTWLDTDTEP